MSEIDTCTVIQIKNGKVKTLTTSHWRGKSWVIYQHYQENVEQGPIVKLTLDQLVVRAELEHGTSWFQFWRPNHSGVFKTRNGEMTKCHSS